MSHNTMATLSLICEIPDTIHLSDLVDKLKDKCDQLITKMMDKYPDSYAETLKTVTDEFVVDTARQQAYNALMGHLLDCTTQLRGDPLALARSIMADMPRIAMASRP